MGKSGLSWLFERVKMLKQFIREIGCEIEIIEDIGIVEEYMAQDEIIQETYVFVGRVLEKGKIDYQNQELELYKD